MRNGNDRAHDDFDVFSLLLMILCSGLWDQFDREDDSSLASNIKEGNGWDI